MHSLLYLFSFIKRRHILCLATRKPPINTKIKKQIRKHELTQYYFEFRQISTNAASSSYTSFTNHHTPTFYGNRRDILEKRTISASTFFLLPAENTLSLVLVWCVPRAYGVISVFFGCCSF